VRVMNLDDGQTVASVAPIFASDEVDDSAGVDDDSTEGSADS